MSSSFTGNQNNFLPQNFIIPENASEKDVMLRLYLNSIASATNSKDSGLYDSQETITGQQFLPTFSTDTGANASYREVLRKVIDFGALPASGTSIVSHGITFTSDMSVTRLYGGATEPGTTWIPLPFASPTLNENISLSLNSTNIVITVGKNRSTFTRSFVVVEWINTT